MRGWHVATVPTFKILATWDLINNNFENFKSIIKHRLSLIHIHVHNCVCVGSGNAKNRRVGEEWRSRKHLARTEHVITHCACPPSDGFV